MKRILLCGTALVLLVASAARADIRVPPPPPPPKPPTKPTRPALDSPTTVAGVAAAAGIVLAGLWVARSRRRVQPLS